MQVKVEERRTFKIFEKDGELNVVTPHLGGGIISKEIIDQLSEYPKLNKIQISGLTDETLDYFVTARGNQFTKIHFFKCPKIENLKCLGKLSLVEEVEFYWNQRASRLWDMSGNINLKSLALFDFRKQIDLSLLPTANSLTKFEMGSLVPHGKTSILSTEPFSKLPNLQELRLIVDHIEHNDFAEFTKINSLEVLHVSPTMYKLEVFAWLKAHLPKGASNNLIAPTETLTEPFEINGKLIDTYVIGKGQKKWLNSVIDSTKIRALNEEFETLTREYKMDKNLIPK